MKPAGVGADKLVNVGVNPMRLELLHNEFHGDQKMHFGQMRTLTVALKFLTLISSQSSNMYALAGWWYARPMVLDLDCPNCLSEHLGFISTSDNAFRHCGHSSLSAPTSPSRALPSINGATGLCSL